jgi:hypothetical protein
MSTDAVKAAPAPVPIVAPTNPSVVHKSGDLIHPDGYPCMAHDGSLKPTEKVTEKIITDKAHPRVGQMHRQIRCPYAGDADLTDDEKRYLISVNHWYSIQEKPAALVDPVAARFIQEIGQPLNAESVETFNEYAATLIAPAGPRVGDFMAYFDAKHIKQASGEIVIKASSGGTSVV